MEHALPRRTGGIPRSWSLCMISENHGTVGPAGCKFSHAPDKHERVLVVEVPTAASAPVDQVSLQLVTSAGGQADVDRALRAAQAWVNEEYMCGRRMGKGEPAMSDRAETAKTECITAILALAAPVAAQAGQVALPEGFKLVPVEPTLDMVIKGFESAPDHFFSPTAEWKAYAAMTGCQKAAHRARLCYAAMLAAAPAAPGNSPEIPDGSISAPGTPEAPFQARVEPWMAACFGPRISADTTERNHRFIEEALELVQAGGMPKADVLQLVDYTYGRPIGELQQEVGSVMVTLAALCLAQSLDMHQAAEIELARIWTKVETIREKQRTKPRGSPLPMDQRAAQLDGGQGDAK